MYLITHLLSIQIMIEVILIGSSLQSVLDGAVGGIWEIVEVESRKL